MPAAVFCFRTFLSSRFVFARMSFKSVNLRPFSHSCYFDEAVRLKVNGLKAEKCVELRSECTDDKGIVFRASATYKANDKGEIDVNCDPSLGGSFTGIEPMGLFWSMTSDVPHSKFTKRDVTSPLLVHLSAISPGVDEEVLAKETVERRFTADGVRRIPVNVGRIRGTLFLPPGSGPFPGVLDLYILGGNMSEPRASLLANKGFAVLALAYYGYQDLPKRVSELHLEYFEEAINFLRKHPKVKGPGIGILSISKSGDLALAMASFLPGVSATVCINGCNANTMYPLHYKDRVIPPLMPNTNKIVITTSGLLDVRDALEDPMSEGNRVTVIPIEQASCNFLFLVSEDDRNWNSPLFAEQATNQLQRHGKGNFELVTYPKAGHFLEVPYMPYCPSSFHAAVGKVVVFGGEPKAHSEAQVDAWRRIQEFFREHLESRTGHVKAML